MSEAVRVREGGVARAKFARGRRTLRLSARVLRGGCGPRVHGKPADLERVVGASGGGREGWRVRREGSFARRERTEVVKMMCADVGLQPETLAIHSSELLHEENALPA